MKGRKTLSNLIIIILAVLCILAGLFFLCPFIINNNYEKHEKNGNFLESDRKALFAISSFKVPEGYVTNYNLGNYYYNTGDYENAVNFYKKALEWAPTDKEKDCNIRINLVLSYLNQMDFEEIEKAEDKSDAINKLKTYRNILTENGCANEKKDVFDGHSKDAEKLKKDIDDELEKLGDNSSNSDENQNQKESDEQSDEKDEESSTDKDLENRLNQQRSNNNKDRQKSQTETRQQNSGQVPNAADNSNNSGQNMSDGTGQEGDEGDSENKHSKNW